MGSSFAGLPFLFGSVTNKDKSTLSFTSGQLHDSGGDEDNPPLRSSKIDHYL
jgi:hypothetical protein